MIYKFKSRAAGDLLMTAPVGDRVLAIIGKAATPQGIIEPDQMPAAIAALQAAVESEDAPADDAGDEKAPGAGVSLRQRVWPMVEMLKQASAEKQPITWGA